MTAVMQTLITQIIVKQMEENGLLKAIVKAELQCLPEDASQNLMKKETATKTRSFSRRFCSQG